VLLKCCNIAGYDIKSEEGYEQMKAEFEEVIGRQYLKAVHLNDSQGNIVVGVHVCIHRTECCL